MCIRDSPSTLVVTFTSSDASPFSKAFANSLNKFPSPLYSGENETLLLSTVTDFFCSDELSNQMQHLW